MAATDTPVEEQVSSFKPHHRVSITYDSEHPTLRPRYNNFIDAERCIDNSSKRFQPLPLVDDAMVTAHTDRVNLDETSFYSTYKAGHGTIDALAEIHMDAGMGEPLKDLLRDMKLVIGCPGSTVLEIGTFCDEALEDKLENADMTFLDVVILRRSDLMQTDVQREGGSSVQYEIPLSEFEDIECADQWYLDIMDLIYGKTDRAVRHREFYTRRVRLPHPDESQEWLPRRFPPHQDVFAEAGILVAHGSDSASCAICADEYDDEESTPMKLPCGHQCCHACVLRISKSQSSAESACCPYCRAKLYRGEVLESLKYGTINGVYRADHLNNAAYNPWENFERSCADLDKELAEENDTRIPISQSIISIFETAWHKLSAGCDLELPDSTPYHLQPHRAPEASAVLPMLLASLQEHQRITMPLSMLFKDICHAIRRGFYLQFMRSEMQSFCTPAALQTINVSKNFKTLGLPPGFWQWVCRMLNRSLMVLLRRQCLEDGRGGGKWHKYGLRDYYNPKEWVG